MPGASPDLLPARILNEHVYCPRLAYLEWVDGKFSDSADTVEGTLAHRRVDSERGPAPAAAEIDAGEDAPPSTAVTLSSARLGLIARIDMVEFADGKARPLEYKRGKPRDPEAPLWDPELVQLCAQVLLLRDAGYEVSGAEVYFVGSRTRHAVPIDSRLIERTCGQAAGPGRLIATDPAAAPLYVTAQGGRLSKRGGRAVLLEDGKEVQSKRIIDISHVAVFGNASIGSALLRELFDRGIPVLWLSYGGWLAGATIGMPPKNVELRQRQYRAATLGAPEIAGAFVSGKIRNARTLLRRQAKVRPEAALAQLASLAKKALSTRELDSLLGVEGAAARIYFEHFPKLIRDDRLLDGFDFDGRSRRPPTDRLNALLSFGYSMLVKDTVSACLAAGLDPYAGLYHRPRFGRPALALDLAEEFRPLIGDSTVLTAVNNGEIDVGDFVERAGAVALTPQGRKRFIRTYERRMTTELKHPIFGYKASYRRTLEIQARLLAAKLSGDSPQYRPLITR